METKVGNNKVDLTKVFICGEVVLGFAVPLTVLAVRTPNKDIKDIFFKIVDVSQPILMQIMTH